MDSLASIRKNELASLYKSGLAVAIIVSLGVMLAISGLLFHFEITPFKHLGSTNALVMMTAGSGALLLSLTLWIIGSVKKSIRSDFALLIDPFSDTRINKHVIGVYILSNETGTEKSIQVVADQPQTNALKCHMGVGALHNFDIMAARQSDYGILFDFNPHNKEFIDQCLNCLKSAKTPLSFVESMISYMKRHLQKYNHYSGNASQLTRMQAELTRPSSWLSTQEGFEHIKRSVQTHLSKIFLAR
jgi:hypothetical protein